MENANQTRLIAKVLRELVTTTRYTEYVDLKDDLRRRLAKMRVRYRQCDFDAAISLVESNTMLIHTTVQPTPAARPAAPTASEPPISRPEAARIVSALYARLRRRTA